MRLHTTDDVVADITNYLVHLNDVLLRGRFGAVIPSVIDVAERSDRMAASGKATAAQRRSAMVERLEVAQATGALMNEADADLLCAALVGPLFYRRFFSRQPTGPAFIAALTRSVLGPYVKADAYSSVVFLRS